MRYKNVPAATTRFPRESPLPLSGSESASETDEKTTPLNGVVGGSGNFQINVHGAVGTPLTVVCLVDIAYTWVSLVTYTRFLYFAEMVGELLMSPSEMM